jgi:glycosyltransferase involved in cell wall biosynthesis
MRVALSLLTLIPGISGGSETYARALCRALSDVGRHQYQAVTPTLAPDAGDGLESVVATSYRVSTTTSGRLLAMGRAAVLGRELRSHFAAADVVHYPLTVPVPRTDQPTVLTLLDVQHLDLPGLFPRGERAFRRLAYDRAATRADRVIVISDWVRERVIERLQLDPDRVHAIHLGVDHDVFTPDPTVEREPLLYYPARPWPHKNHARLYEALALVRRSRPELRLVLTGAGHAAGKLPDGVEALGDTDLATRVSLYRRASLVVFPSLYEGFGLPPLEAMACGCPVACSDAGSLPEIAGDAAVLFDPRDPAAIAAGVEDALRHSVELGARGRERAARFTWDATARAHDDVYELAAGV